MSRFCRICARPLRIKARYATESEQIFYQVCGRWNTHRSANTPYTDHSSQTKCVARSLLRLSPFLALSPWAADRNRSSRYISPSSSPSVSTAIALLEQFQPSTLHLTLYKTSKFYQDTISRMRPSEIPRYS